MMKTLPKLGPRGTISTNPEVTVAKPPITR